MGPYLPDSVRRHAMLRPQAPAITEAGETLSYGSLDTRSNKIAQALLSAGLGTGARVGCLVRPGRLSAELLLACAKAGLVLAPLNWRLVERELTAVARDAQLEVVVTQEEFLPGARAVRGAISGLRVVTTGEPAPDESAYEAWLEAAPDIDPGRGGESDAHMVFLQLYTSGTTGRPKGVQLTLENLHAGEIQAAELGWSEDSVSLNAMPVFHVAGTGWLATALGAGAHTVALPDLVPQRVVDVLESERVTHVLFVPAVLQMLTQLPGIRERDFSALRLIVYGASPITPALLRRSMEIFGCDFCQRYGQTETTGCVTRLLPVDHDADGPRAHLLRSAGNTSSDVDLVIADLATGKPVPAGTVGEILTRSHHVTPGYWRRAEENGELFTDEGWLRTGDAGYVDEEGYLFITDRIKDMVITGGENVYPIEVESALAEHPAVRDVAVFGTPDERWGEAVTAAVVLNADAAGTTEAELIDFTRARIASYKKPRVIHFVDELPRNPTGKVLKHVLRKDLAKGGSGMQ
ncbi:long-chain-fatty-acid--CoA ligase [Streptomyces sp. NPDC048309]|uniref:long-chain-fatty-acid--CoA ligase n=1 Tax=Streptomyces sp. NPDC048309 TaxID=3154618 RepID=UPI0033F4C330